MQAHILRLLTTEKKTLEVSLLKYLKHSWAFSNVN